MHHTLNKDNKESLLILKILWTLISQKEKDTVLSLGVCCSNCCFVGQPKREKLSFRSYPSLFRGELKTEIELFWERRHPSHTSPLPFSLLQRKWFAYTFPSELCPRLLLTDAIWKNDWRGKRCTLIRHCQSGLEQSRTLSPLLMEDDPGEIAASLQLLRTSLDVFWKQLALQTPVNYVHFL